MFHDDKSPLNDVAPANIPDIVVTLAVSHEDKSPLNNVAPSNIPYMVATLEVFHPEISSLNDKCLAHSDIIANVLFHLGYTRHINYNS